MRRGSPRRGDDGLDFIGGALLANIAPTDVSPHTDHVKVRIRILDEAFAVDLEAFGFEEALLLRGELGVHVRADAGVGADDAVPGDGLRFFIREAAEYGGDVSRDDIHVHGDAAVSRELALRDQGDEAQHFSADAGIRWRHGVE